MDTFNPTIAPESANPNHTVNVNRNDFEEGYDQNVLVGLHPVRVKTMSLSWSVLSTEQTNEIIDWFISHAGQRFYWALPGRAAQMWTCDEWSPTNERNAVTGMTATFREVFV